MLLMKYWYLNADVTFKKCIRGQFHAELQITILEFLLHAVSLYTCFYGVLLSLANIYFKRLWSKNKPKFGC